MRCTHRISQLPECAQSSGDLPCIRRQSNILWPGKCIWKGTGGRRRPYTPATAAGRGTAASNGVRRQLLCMQCAAGGHCASAQPPAAHALTARPHLAGVPSAHCAGRTVALCRTGSAGDRAGGELAGASNTLRVGCSAGTDLGAAAHAGRAVGQLQGSQEGRAGMCAVSQSDTAWMRALWLHICIPGSLAAHLHSRTLVLAPTAQATCAWRCRTVV